MRAKGEEERGGGRMEGEEDGWRDKGRKEKRRQREQEWEPQDLLIYEMRESRSLGNSLRGQVYLLPNFTLAQAPAFSRGKVTAVVSGAFCKRTVPFWLI